MSEVDIDSSTTSSFDPDETALETSMMLLSPTMVQRPISPEISKKVTKDADNYTHHEIGGGENYLESQCDDDPDETILEGVEEANIRKSGLERSILSTPLKTSNIFRTEESPTLKTKKHSMTVENNHVRFMEKDHFTDESHKFDSVTEGGNDHDDKFKHHYNTVKSVIAKHRHLVQLPPLDSNDNVDKRIHVLYLYIKESGIQRTIDKLGLNESLLNRSCSQKDYSSNSTSSKGALKPSIDTVTDYSKNLVVNVETSSGADSSVEIGRCNNDQNKLNLFQSTSFQSPIFNHDDDQVNKISKKRQASTSGKKGTDLHRKRLDDERIFHPIHEESSRIDCQMDGSHFVQSFRSIDGHSDLISSPLQSEKNHSSFLNSALFSPISHQESLPVCQDDSFSSSLSLQTQMSQHYCQLETKCVEGQIKFKLGQKNCDEYPKTINSYNESPPRNKNKTFSNGSSESCGTNKTQQKSKSSDFDKNTSQVFCTSYNAPSEDSSRDKNIEYSIGEESDEASSYVSYLKDSYSIESVNSMELDHRGKIGQIEHRNSYKEEKMLQYNVTLKGNSCIQYNPLKVYRPPKWAKIYENKRNCKLKQSRKEHNQRNQDVQLVDQNARPLPTLTMIQSPFKEFGSRHSERLNVVLDWLMQRERCSSNEEEESSLSGKAIILSLNQRQITCLVLQLILVNSGHPNDDVPYKNRKFLGNSGGTLIVVKAKDEICGWECELREKTAFSVFNHAALSSSERRSANIKSKASSFDVVLTTYDALKSKEVTVSVDVNGRVTKQTEHDGGWLASRTKNQSDEEDKVRSAVLSRLHLLCWQRIVFIDDLGRKSYLTKPGTSRAEVACSLTGRSKTICFVKSSDQHFFFEDKVKESRRQLIPLAKMFDVPTNRTADDIVGKIMLDYRDVREEENDGEEQLSECTSRFSYCSIGLSD